MKIFWSLKRACLKETSHDTIESRILLVKIFIFKISGFIFLAVKHCQNFVASHNFVIYNNLYCREYAWTWSTGLLHSVGGSCWWNTVVREGATEHPWQVCSSCEEGQGHLWTSTKKCIVCSLLLEQGTSIQCTLIWTRRNSADLP